MKKAVFAVLASLLLAVSVVASPTADVLKPIHQFIDGFNKGDTASGFAAYSSGDIAIVDEFAPHLWTGRDAAHKWADDYDKHSKASGVTDGVVKYGAPLVTNVEGDVAYVVIPTTYDYKEKGTAMTESGRMAFVLHKESAGWKITAWTWTGTRPKAAK